MAIRADMQAQLDRLAAVPAAIQAATAAAVAAAEASATQDHADEVAAVTQATDAIALAVQPAPAG